MSDSRVKLERILRAKSSFTDQQIASLSDAEGWDWIYRNSPAPKDKSHQIAFTGFSASECDELKALAAATGWLQVVNTVTKTLSYLCHGPNAGPAKMAKAQAQGATLLDRDQLDTLIEEGVIPDHAGTRS